MILLLHKKRAPILPSDRVDQLVCCVQLRVQCALLPSPYIRFTDPADLVTCLFCCAKPIILPCSKSLQLLEHLCIAVISVFLSIVCSLILQVCDSLKMYGHLLYQHKRLCSTHGFVDSQNSLSLSIMPIHYIVRVESVFKTLRFQSSFV